MLVFPVKLNNFTIFLSSQLELLGRMLEFRSQSVDGFLRVLFQLFGIVDLLARVLILADQVVAIGC